MPSFTHLRTPTTEETIALVSAAFAAKEVGFVLLLRASGDVEVLFGQSPLVVLPALFASMEGLADALADTLTQMQAPETAH